MINGQKRSSAAEMNIEMPERKVTAAAEVVTKSGPLVLERSGRKIEAAQVGLRVGCLFSAVVAISMMTTAKQSSIISIYGFNLPITSKWSFSDSFLYLVGVSAAVAVHSILHLFITASRFLKKIPLIPSRIHLWLYFAGDQLFAYMMMSAGSAASGVNNLNHAGIRHSSLPNFCKPLHVFCDHVAVSIAFTFFTCFLLAMSVVVDVIWLSYL